LKRTRIWHALLASFSRVDAELQLEASKKEAEAKAQNELRLKKREREHAEATLRACEDLAEKREAYLKKAVDGQSADDEEAVWSAGRRSVYSQGK